MNKYRREEDDPRQDEKYRRVEEDGSAPESEEEPMEAACGGYAGGMSMMGEGLMGPDMLTATMYSGKDPVSGNPVPIGADEENVRDDIPAMISEGEYVLPADVVKYHGLKGILDFQNEARQGLMSMAMEGLIQQIDPEMEEDAEGEESEETPEGNEVEEAEFVVEEETMEQEEPTEEDMEDTYPTKPGQMAVRNTPKIVFMR